MNRNFGGFPNSQSIRGGISEFRRMHTSVLQDPL